MWGNQGLDEAEPESSSRGKFLLPKKNDNYNICDFNNKGKQRAAPVPQPRYSESAPFYRILIFKGVVGVCVCVWEMGITYHINLTTRSQNLHTVPVLQHANRPHVHQDGVRPGHRQLKEKKKQFDRT